MLSLKLNIVFYKKRKEIDKILRYIKDPLGGPPPIPEAPFTPNNLVTLLSVIYADNAECMVITEWKIDSETEQFLVEKYTSIMGYGERIYFSNLSSIGRNLFHECMEEMEVELPSYFFINKELKELWAIPDSSQGIFPSPPRGKKHEKNSSVRGSEKKAHHTFSREATPYRIRDFFVK